MKLLIVQWIPFFPTSGFFNGPLQLVTDIQGVYFALQLILFFLLFICLLLWMVWTVVVVVMWKVFLQGVTTYTCGLISGISEIEAFDSIFKSISQV